MFRRVLLLVPVLLLATAPGCVGCGGEPEAFDAASALGLRFPAEAARVLEARDAFVETAEGFAVAEDAAPFTRGLAAVLPRGAGGAVRFELPSGFAVRVRERDLTGEGAPAGRAVAYARAGGTSFWTAGAGDFEEWLSLDAGVANGDRAVAAWDVEGGALRMGDGAVEVLDDAGVPRIRVQAPEARTAGGALVEPRLTVRGATIELWADARGEAVLVDPAWTATTNMVTSRGQHTGTLLPDGRVLVAGGVTYTNTNGCIFSGTHVSVSAVETFDPATTAWTSQPAMSVQRYLHTATRLLDGRVLVAGGYTNACSPTAHATAEIYDPVTSTWGAPSSMSAARGYHSATRLANGKVLVIGGFAAGSGLTSTDVYDPGTNTWSPGTSMSAVRYAHVAVTLLDGRILVTAGNNTMSPLKTGEIYDPVADAWSPIAQMTIGAYHRRGATMGDGRVLVTGGVISGGQTVWQSGAEIYDPATNVWTNAPPMSAPRSIHGMLLLASGRVLVAGGETTSTFPMTQSLLFDPVSGTWSTAGTQAGAEPWQSLTQLASGKVLTAGGFIYSMTVKTADIFDEGAFVGSGCAVGTDCASGFCADGVCCNTACAAGACDACSIAAGASQNGICKLLTGNACSDGTACTTGDTCQSGVCTGAPVVCAPQDACHVAGACNAGTGVCSNPAKANGAACDDGDACTSGESCQGGACGSGIPVVCAPPDACHLAGACNAGTGICAYASKQDGTACSDGSACTTGDACQGGVCVGSAIVCAPQGACHVAGTCDPVTGLCDSPAAPDGAPCDDGDACTLSDTCQAGACAAGGIVACPAQDECHDAGACNPATGACSNPVKGDGAPCSGGVCSSGACAAIDAGADSGTGGTGGAGATGGTGGVGASGGMGATTTGTGEATSSSGGGTGPTGDGAPAETGGCGCGVAGSPTTGGLWVGLGVLLAVRRRRERARAASRDQV